MKFPFGTVLAFFILISSFSWSKDVGRPDDASHDAILQKMNLKTFKNLNGRFAQNKLLTELNVEIKTDGSFEVTRDTGAGAVFHWNVEKPKPSSICLDNLGVVMDSGGTKKKITFSEIGDESGKQISSLLKLMSSDPKLLVEDFKIKEVVGQDRQFLLSPIKPENVFFKEAILSINSVGLVEKIKLIEKTNDELTIQFSELKTDKGQNIKSCKL